MIMATIGEQLAVIRKALLKFRGTPKVGLAFHPSRDGEERDTIVLLINDDQASRADAFKVAAHEALNDVGGMRHRVKTWIVAGDVDDLYPQPDGILGYFTPVHEGGRRIGSTEMLTRYNH